MPAIADNRCIAAGSSTSMVCPGRSSFGLGEMPQDQDADQSPRMKRPWLAGQAQYRRPEGSSRAAPTVQATPQRRTPINVDTPASDRVVLTRLIDAPREKLFRAWTEPEVLKQWFTPAPYTTPVAELDVRPVGANLIVMRGPDGIYAGHVEPGVAGRWLVIVETDDWRLPPVEVTGAIDDVRLGATDGP